MNLKKIVRSSHCLNCETPLNIEVDNFCPNCGQVNNTKKETAFGLVKELVEEFLHLDSKVFKSVVPLLFKPGFLTVDYIQGKRARYFHPVRMFLIVTVIMFIVSSFASSKIEKDRQEEINEYLRDSSKAGVDPRTIRPDSILTFDSESWEFKNEANPKESDTTNNFYWSFGDVEIQKDTLQRYLDLGITDPSALMDTFKIERSFFNTLFFNQAVKSQLAGKEKVFDYYKHKLPWILFSLMPVFAFVLYLFYIRRKIFFVDHLIHAFHLHTATFSLVIIQDILSLIFSFDTTNIYWLIPIYYFISLKKVYRQSLWKTIFKGVAVGIFYLIFGIIVIFIVAALLFLMI